MKKIFFVLILVLSFLFVSCQGAQLGNNIDSSGNSADVSTDLSDGTNKAPFEENKDDLSENIPPNDPLPNESISIRSVDELNLMREMLLCEDEKELNDYLIGVEGSGANNKEDLKKFIDLVDSTLCIDIIEGDIEWISYSRGQTQELNNYEILYVTINGINGEWVRFEYMLSISDASNKALKEKQNLKSENLILQPLKNADAKTVFFSETREKHISGTGDVIKWIASIDDIYTNIVYYTVDATKVNTVDLLTKVQSVNVIEKK